MGDEEFVEPQGPLEQLVAGVFGDLLGIDRVSARKSFFEMGGNSLMAATLASRIQEYLGVRIGIRDLFEAQTVTELATTIAARRDAGDDGVDVAPRFTRLVQDESLPVPLSLAQRRLWFINSYDPTSGAYNIPFALMFTGDLDIDALSAALVDLVDRQRVLRTIYPSDSAGPHQVVVPTIEALPPVRVDTIERSRAWDRLREFAVEGFDVTTTVPVRTALWELVPDEGAAQDGPPEHLLVFVLHTSRRMASRCVHSPATCSPPTRRAVAVPTPRGNRSPRSTPTTPSGRTRRSVRSTTRNRSRLGSSTSGVGPSPVSPRSSASRPTAPAVSPVGDRGDPGLRGARRDPQAIVGLANSQGVSRFMVLHAALAVLLARQANENDIVIGTPIGGRGTDELDALVGMFVNTLVLRTQVEPDATVADVLRVARRTDLDAFAHSDVPFEQVVDALAPTRTASHTPLFQVVLGVNGTDGATVELDGLTVRPGAVDTEYSKFDLTVDLTEQFHDDGAPAGIAGFMGYAVDIFDPETVDGLARRLVRLLDGMTADPARSPGRSRSWTPRRPRSSPPCVAPRSTSNPSPSPGCSTTPHRSTRRPRPWSRATGRSPTRSSTVTRTGWPVSSSAAVSARRTSSRWHRAEHPFGDRDLGRRAQRCGLRPGRSHLPGRPRRAHGRGFPCGAGHHDHRRRRASARRGGMARHRRSGVRRSPGRARPGRRVGPRGPPGRTRLHHLHLGDHREAEGVEVTHSGLAPFSAEQLARYSTTPAARVMQFASPSFDASVLELLLAVGAGATLVIVPPGVYGGDELRSLLVEQRVTHGFITPSALASVDPAGVDDFTHFSIGGEAVPSELIARWAPGRAVMNGYGPTEATIMVTLTDPLTGDSRPTIGSLVRGASAVVLDARLRPTPLGVPGDLYVSGPGVSRGYRDRRDSPPSGSWLRPTANRDR